MIDFWFFQNIEKTENYSLRMAQKAVIIVPGQHLTVYLTPPISSCLNPAASCKKACNHKNLESFK